MLPVTTPGAEIVFEGTCNFRELGGYRAADGRHVRRGLLYRGCSLDTLQSPADRTKLESLHLREILDLRSAGEAARQPDVAVSGAHYQRICGMRYADGSEMDFSPAGIQRAFMRRRINAQRQTGYDTDPCPRQLTRHHTRVCHAVCARAPCSDNRDRKRVGKVCASPDIEQMRRLFNLLKQGRVALFSAQKDVHPLFLQRTQPFFPLKPRLPNLRDTLVAQLRGISSRILQNRKGTFHQSQCLIPVFIAGYGTHQKRHRFRFQHGQAPFRFLILATFASLCQSQNKKQAEPAFSVYFQ